jgi:hypothetical protein
MIAFNAITIDLNETSSRTNARIRTNANTIGAEPFIELPKSFEIAVSPVTPASTPSTAPTVSGTIWRSVEIASYEVSSLPLPARGRSMRATVRSGLTSTVTGSWAAPLATACSRRSSIPSLTRGSSIEDALTTTDAGCCSPGNESWSRLYVWTACRSCGNASAPGTTVFIPRAGKASATRIPADTTAERSGRRSTRSSIQPQPRPPPGRWRRCRSGMRALFTLSPSLDRSAGSTVSDPSTAIATTMMVAIANELKTSSPVKNMPAIAAITVKPETSTARPDVAAAASSAAVSLRPAARSSRSRLR